MEPRPNPQTSQKRSANSASRSGPLTTQLPFPHIPILREEVVDALALAPGSRVIDATVGDGGHAHAILEQTAPDGQLLALDADPVSIKRAKQTLAPFGSRVTFAILNFANLDHVPSEYPSFASADAILFDLGYSTAQIHDETRGFSFSARGLLDMRYGGESQLTLRACDVLNTYPASQLETILREYGEERHAASIAHEIIRERHKQTFSRPEQLTSAVLRTYQRLGHAPRRIHPATKTFMALRIAVNGELDALTAALPAAITLLRPGGRLAVITFHSLEDRIVKRNFQREARGCLCPPEFPVCRCNHRATLRIVTRHAIRPAPAEVQENPSSRSAQLRVAERKKSLHP